MTEGDPLELAKDNVDMNEEKMNKNEVGGKSVEVGDDVENRGLLVKENAQVSEKPEKNDMSEKENIDMNKEHESENLDAKEATEIYDQVNTADVTTVDLTSEDNRNREISATEAENASEKEKGGVIDVATEKKPSDAQEKQPSPKRIPKRRRNRRNKSKHNPVSEPEKKTEHVKVTWRGHAETTPFSLPVTSELLQKSALDAEVPRNPLGSLGRHPRAKVPETTDAPNWSNLVTTLEERKEIAAPQSTGAWHEMPHAQLTTDQIRDLRVIENRQHLDPKRFYKSGGSGRKRGELPSQVQFGTVIEGAHEFYSSRLTKRERRTTVTEEVMADDRVRSFTKRRNSAIQKHATRKRRVIDPAASKKRRY